MNRVIALCLASCVAVATTVAVAADDPIQTRQAIMSSVGAAAGLGGGMLKGEIDFSPAAAAAALSTFNAAAFTFGDYFPEGSESGGDTEAAPTIWSDAAGFAAASDKFRSDASAALASKPQTLDDFKAAFGSVAQNCKACHEDFRVTKN